MAAESPPSSPSRSHQRRASVGLSPFWIDLHAAKEDNEAVASPRARSKGRVEVEINPAFFPLPLLADDTSAERAFLHPDKRLSERHRKANLIPKEISTREKDIAEAVAAATASITSSSDEESVHSEFSENTAGSKYAVC